jgi:hypothetical protein
MMFHKHKWTLVDKTVIEGRKFQKMRMDDSYEARKLLQGYVVYAWSCECGKTKTEAVC